MDNGLLSQSFVPHFFFENFPFDVPNAYWVLDNYTQVVDGIPSSDWTIILSMSRNGLLEIMYSVCAIDARGAEHLALNYSVTYGHIITETGPRYYAQVPSHWPVHSASNTTILLMWQIYDI